MSPDSSPKSAVSAYPAPPRVSTCSSPSRKALHILRYPAMLTVSAIAIVTVLAQVALFSASLWSGGPGVEPAAAQVGGMNAQAALVKQVSDCSTSLPAILLVTVFGFVGAIYFLIVRVFVPLSEIKASLTRISCGDLSATAPRTKEKALMEVAETVNEIAANFQEALLLTGTAAGNIRAGLKRMEDLLKQASKDPVSKDMPTHLADLRKNAELLSVMVAGFQYFHTDFDGGKVVADDKGCEASHL